MARTTITEVTHSGPYITFTGKRWNKEALSVTVHASVKLGTGPYSDGRGVSLNDRTTGERVLFSWITPDAERAAYRALNAACVAAGTPALTTHRLERFGKMTRLFVCLEYPDGTQATYTDSD
ncbi:hypothetical protein [Deinococcus ruber]|uniref:Uncharacterized protein n=1 Tax=Deinococcus ruber TaxID=1848197 RepID=A0A918CJJ9_9DEIO|nr:hypothetical protein [Deinococcus ruber]GGR27766.1 hypothetical protein GCM10008957_43750 [Deinococcus ruber]